ncbi:MAG: CopG family transcriptional regulator [Cyanobium sp.]
MLNFRAPGSLADLLDDLARRIGTSRSALIREAVVQYVQQLDDSDRGDPPNSP